MSRPTGRLVLWLASGILPILAGLLADSPLVDRILRATYVTDPPGPVYHFDYYFHRFYLMLSRPALLAVGAFTLALPLLAACLARLSPNRVGVETLRGLWGGRATLRAAVVLSATGVAAAALVGRFVLQDFANSADEWAFQFHARTLLAGEWDRNASADPLIPTLGTGYFVIAKGGKWFANTFPGWPALLALGMRFGVGWLVNPLLGGLALLFTYLAGRELLGSREGLLAAGLSLVSPFFLLNSGSYFSQPTTLACTAAALWLVSRSIRKGSGSAAFSAGAALGLAFVTRPYTALAIGIPLVAALALSESRRRSVAGRVRDLALFGSAVALVSIPLFVSNAAVTGDPLTTPYTWSGNRDVPGFFENGYSVHTPADGVVITVGHLLDLWVWLPFAALPLAALGVLGVEGWRRRVLAAIPLALVAFYWAYLGYGGNQYGPRYYYEALPALTLLAAAGFASFRDAIRARFGAAAEPRITLGLAALAAVGHLGVASWLLYVHARVIDERVRPYELAAEANLENAVVLLETGSGTMELLDLVRNDPCCDAPVVYAPSPDFVAAEAGERAAETYIRALRARFAGRQFWTFRYGEPGERGPEFECVRWPPPEEKGELERSPHP